MKYTKGVFIEIELNKQDMFEDEPDGGYGWVVVFGTFCVQVTTFGLVASW
jgi:hypothetical protein